ncbi:hypothetical protein V6N13_040311 [Hibiscus sabdariffa]|uniref:Uncharacterized protein n=1 Tax=Hibiscus sabdariffa TaxID=183260 RepID=A0ABR2R8Q4_9ROSI
MINFLEVFDNAKDAIGDLKLVEERAHDLVRETTSYNTEGKSEEAVRGSIRVTEKGQGRCICPRVLKPLGIADGNLMLYGLGNEESLEKSAPNATS